MPHPLSLISTCTTAPFPTQYSKAVLITSNALTETLIPQDSGTLMKEMTSCRHLMALELIPAVDTSMFHSGDQLTAQT